MAIRTKKRGPRKIAVVNTSPERMKYLEALATIDQNQETIKELVDCLNYVWERVYCDANAKYQLKEPFDLNRIIALAEAHK